jgi:hypothetical protein
MSQMSVGLFNNTKHWQERAEEARVHAEQLTDPEAKRMMLEIAESYQRFVKRAQERQLSAGPAEKSKQRNKGGRGANAQAASARPGGPMPVGLLNSVMHWRERAEGARVYAEQLTDIEAERVMFGIAETYKSLAKRAEGRQLSAGSSETQMSGQIGVRQRLSPDARTKLAGASELNNHADRPAAK